MDSNLIWNVIDKYFNHDRYTLVSHQIDSFNDFFSEGIKNIFKEKNPIKIIKKENPTTKEYDYNCNLFIGGKDGSKIYFGKPVIYDDENNVQFMYPNKARLRNMTYGLTIHYDVDVEFKIKIEDKIYVKSIVLPKIYLGRFPIMLHSNSCILRGLDREVAYNMGECKNDMGGYFIIGGKEKSIVCQEKFADNMLNIREDVSDIYSHSADVKSRSEDASKHVRTTSVKIIKPNDKYSNNQIVVEIPNVRKPVPLFILMRALGVLSDKDIIQHCLLDLHKNKDYIDLFIPSIHDASTIFTQEAALQYIAVFTKRKTQSYVYDILMNYFIPHMGELNFKDKAIYIGTIVFKLLKVFNKEEAPTDRDNFKYKRVELPGTLLYDLFKEYYNLMQQEIFTKFDKEYFYKEAQYEGMGNDEVPKFIGLITNNYTEYFREKGMGVNEGFRKAFKGNWGSQTHTKKLGVVQDLNRLSFNSALSQKRKLSLPLDSSAKVVGPRLCHGSQWGLIDPVDTPDGGNIGIHKHLAISTKITKGYSMKLLLKWMREHGKLILLNETSLEYISYYTKIYINGSIVGIITEVLDFINEFKKYKRLNCIPLYTSYSWNINENLIEFYTDSGRLTRPLFYIENKKSSVNNKELLTKLGKKDFTWNNLICGFHNKKDPDFDINNNKFYNIKELYGEKKDGELMKDLCVIDYMDSNEANTSMVSTEHQDFNESKINYTHHEIHPSFLLGVMGNQITYPENNQLPRDLFSCGQSKQAVSLYHTNFNNRMDKFGVILNYGQIPLVKSRYMKYINNEEHPYGENAIIAIMSYNGYNVEDAVLINKGAIDRGLFRTTYFTSYESTEENKVKEGNVGSMINSRFNNILTLENVKGVKPECDYSHLNEYGLIKENTEIFNKDSSNEKTTLIGKTTFDSENPAINIDQSTFTKKGQLGFVDKSFMTDGDEGTRIAKVRIREERIPAIGDKVCSRCGQKGTIGLIVAEEDMPFTVNGMKPDIIINPHAIPSRMTIGQLIESLVGKACAHYGSFGDCTAFVNNGPKHEVFGKLLVNCGFHSSGEELFYNGMTGEQIETNVFVGPTYYMRLKHMVKDKINYRAKGPRSTITRQTVQGRANDGGLRIGEMERDGIISHGAANFLQESMLLRGDLYYMAVCNKTGMGAIYNENKNLFLSPGVDGPINFTNITKHSADINHISRFGREFSIIKIPYSFKLLLQELGTMNIQLRIITEDNIDQIENMSFSDNINKLLMTNEKDVLEKDVSAINIANTRKFNKEKPNENPDIAFKTPDDELEIDYTKLPEMNELYNLHVEYNKGDKVRYNKDVKKEREWTIGLIQDDDNIVLISHDLENIKNIPSLNILEKMDNKITIKVTRKDIYVDYTPSYIPRSPPGSPHYSPRTTPPYAPGSPQYSPGTTPPYAPGSPPYAPGSPQYAPGSPQYAPGTTPPYAHGSPQYDPNTPPISPQYDPNTPPISPQYVPDSPPYAPNSPSIVDSHNGYTPGTPIMITPMVPTQKLSEIKQPQEKEYESSIDENKGVSYSSILENINKNETFDKQTPILTTIEKEQESDEKKEELKSIHL